MKQLALIKQANALLLDYPAIKAALLIGSFARNDAKQLSDIDYALWVEEGFDGIALTEHLRQHLGAAFSLHLSEKQQIAAYFEGAPKLELSYSTSTDKLTKHFLGSEIPSPEMSIILDRTGTLCAKLGDALANKQRGKSSNSSRKEQADELVNRFLYEFEKASASHRRGDSYRAYSYYNIALHAAIQLECLGQGWEEYLFLPKNMNTLYAGDEEQTVRFRELAGSLYLGDLNRLKRNLLEYFYRAIERISFLEDDECKAYKVFLEKVYARDSIWNFRDAASLVSIFPPRKILRCSSLTRYQNEAFFNEWIKGLSVNKVVDLRDDDELMESPYEETALGLFEHIRLPIDPRRQSEEFKAKYHYGTNQEIAYRHFADGHKHCFKKLFEEVDPAEDTILIHCHAGKDRTGSVVALLALLCNASMEEVQADYLASESDTDLANLQAFLEVVHTHGGVEAYLLACGIDAERIDYWKKHLYRHA